jgi:hypothetical protein
MYGSRALIRLFAVASGALSYSIGFCYDIAEKKQA